MKIPKWLKLQGEIDYLLFCLGQMYKEERSLSNFERMIDKATGLEKQKMKEAKKIHGRIVKLKKEYYSL